MSLRTFPLLARLRARLRARGFSHISMTLEAAGVMGWFVVLILSEKYMNDATTSRRTAENSAEQGSVVSAMSYCKGNSMPTSSLGGFSAQGSMSIFANGVPQLTPAQIPASISLVGITSLQTLPVYFNQFQGAQANATANSVTSAAPRNQTSSGQFQGVRNMACLEKSLDLPGAPWVTLATARANVYITNILGYL